MNTRCSIVCLLVVVASTGCKALNPDFDVRQDTQAEDTDPNTQQGTTSGRTSSNPQTSTGNDETTLRNTGSGSSGSSSSGSSSSGNLSSESSPSESNGMMRCEPLDAECNVHLQDCVEGQSCEPLRAEDEGHYVGSACVLLDDDKDPFNFPGDLCERFCPAVFGGDSCVSGSVCDARVLDEPRCVELCEPGRAATCSDVNLVCVPEGGDSVFVGVCRPRCQQGDAAACGDTDDEQCIILGPNSACIPSSDFPPPAVGEGCDFNDRCGEGAICINGTEVAGCDMDRCCARACGEGFSNCLAAAEECVVSNEVGGPSEEIGACVSQP